MGKKADFAEIALITLLIAFGLFVAYQIVRVIFGGSWEAESVVIALLVFSLGLNIAVLRKTDSNSHQLGEIKRILGSLASDFKGHMAKYHSR